MLNKILAITGKPGLFKIISHSSKNLIVEDIISKKRFPVSLRDKVVGLGDIAMYTTSEDKPLGEILDLVYTNEKGQLIDVKQLIAEKGLRDKFREILPDFDEDRVKDSDIKKLFTWYNILVNDGMTKFKEETSVDSEKDNQAEKDSKAEETK